MLDTQVFCQQQFILSCIFLMFTVISFSVFLPEKSVLQILVLWLSAMYEHMELAGCLFFFSWMEDTKHVIILLWIHQRKYGAPPPMKLPPPYRALERLHSEEASVDEEEEEEDACAESKWCYNRCVRWCLCDVDGLYDMIKISAFFCLCYGSSAVWQ